MKTAFNNKTNALQSKMMAVGGLLLTGAGLSMAVDAGTKKATKKKWFLYGTMALVVFNAGLSLVAGSARYTKR